jgi:hypothetical protein
MTPVDLMLDEDNELRFKVNITSSRPGESSCRLMLESGGVQYGFKGTTTADGEIAVTIPPLKSVLNEGIYDTKLEVIVDDKLFVPLEMKVNLEKSVAVTAEAVVRAPKKKKVEASAVLVEAPRVLKNPKYHKEEFKQQQPVKKENIQESRETVTLSSKQILDLINQIKSKKD